MASLGEFSRRMQVLAVRVEQNVERTVKRVALAVDQAVVLATPVDTGRARSNWIAQIGDPARRTVEPYAEGNAGGSAEGALSQARHEIDRFRLGQDIYISNNLPYIERLNQGHSAQAPAGFVEEAVEAGTRVARQARVVPRRGGR